MDQPAWLAQAWAEFGARERPGPAGNARILALYRDAGHAEVAHDEVPWCAAFVGACLSRAGVSHTKSLMARSYAKWGNKIEEGRTGAVVVLSRGSDPALGHVGFLLGVSGKTIFVLGGNQGDAVSVAAFDASRVVAMRWPAPAHIEQSSPERATSTEDQLFERTLAHVLEMEGGYTDDPHDPGGPTNKGILLREFAQWHGVTLDGSNTGAMKAQLRAIPGETVRAIYRQRYWEPAHCAEFPAALALMHFDAAVNHGVGTAIRILQEAAGVEADGEIGPMTRAAIRRTPVEITLTNYADVRRRRYRALAHFWRFGRGWLNRVDRTLAAAREYLDEKIQSQGDHNMAKEQAKDTVSGAGSKWWGQSMTIWGVLITTLSTVVPALGPVIGVDIPGDMVRDAGGQIVTTVQAIGGLAGTLMAIFGRMRANQPLQRRDVSFRL